MYLVAGLGNPGAEYAKTRHNLGFWAVDELAVRLGVKNFKAKHRALLAEAKLGATGLIILKPQTFMNESGLAVQAASAWHKIAPDRLIVIYDDVDLEVGQIRIREKGSAGGHHGMESIIAHLGTTEFARVRIGIGRDSLTGDVSDYVLQPVPAAQRAALQQAAVTAAEAVEQIIARGLPAAMSQFNG
ncbi:MAG: aminoacyl-tRNA hydrolase [Candidatus Margulisbacteria bacterium]|jgi:PTH1 family peptidyl-tRNA hydrolase|nr:aminoacyl-tRNA hydrolase [Candidatus Margulisiibacteriota bacterium]